MAEWEARFGEADEHAGWKEIALPILQLYTESTDGSYVEAKDSALVRERAGPKHSANTARQLCCTICKCVCGCLTGNVQKHRVPRLRRTDARLPDGVRSRLSMTCMIGAQCHGDCAVMCCFLPDLQASPDCVSAPGWLWGVAHERHVKVVQPAPFLHAARCLAGVALPRHGPGLRAVAGQGASGSHGGRPDKRARRGGLRQHHCRGQAAGASLR